ncbi:serine O-acetyltransferase [Thermolongibacillus altinsuensis]
MKLLIPGNQLLFLYRIYNKLYKNKLFRPLGYLLYYVTRIIYSSDIHPNCVIGQGTKIVHHFNIVIGKNAIIGENCNIFNGVTLGEDGRTDYYPVVGDNVTLGTGVKVLGNVKIGSNCIIGAGSVVVHDIPESSLAVGVPAVVKKKINRKDYK